MTAAKAQRCAAARTVRDALRAGASEIVVPLPDGEPARRDTYRAVSAAAYCVAGAGRYRLQQTPDGVLVALRVPA